MRKGSFPLVLFFGILCVFVQAKEKENTFEQSESKQGLTVVQPNQEASKPKEDVGSLETDSVGLSFGDFQMDLEAFGGLNGLNISLKVDGDFKPQFGGLLGGSVVFRHIPLEFLTPKFLFKSDLFVNYSGVSGSGYNVDLVTYNFSQMLGYQISDRIEVYLGSNLVMGFLEDDDKTKVLLSGKLDVRYRWNKLYLGLSYTGIPKRHEINTVSNTKTYRGDLSSIVSLTVSYPLFKKLFQN